MITTRDKDNLRIKLSKKEFLEDRTTYMVILLLVKRFLR